MRNDYDTQDQYGNGNRSFVVGLLCGAAIGTAVGLLMAPKAGDELRSDIANSADRLRKRANDTYDRASATVSDLADKGREAFRRGRETFDDARAAAAREVAEAE